MSNPEGFCSYCSIRTSETIEGGVFMHEACVFQKGYAERDREDGVVGYVYLNAAGRPINVELTASGWWAMYWHADKHWVNLKRMTKGEVEAYRSAAMPVDHAQLYHDQHAGWLKP